MLLDIFASALLSFVYLFSIYLVNWSFYLESLLHFSFIFWSSTEVIFLSNISLLLLSSFLFFIAFILVYGLCPILTIFVFIQMLWLCRSWDKHFCVIWLGNFSCHLLQRQFFSLSLLDPFSCIIDFLKKVFIVEEWKGRIEKRPYW